MAIAFTNLGSSAAPDYQSSGSASSYSNASWSPPTAGLIFCFVYSGDNTTNPVRPTMSGNSLTWTYIAEATTASSYYRLTLFAATASGATTGATTVDFAGDAQANGCSFIFGQVTGVDLTGGAAGAFVKTYSNYGWTNAPSITLDSPASADNRPLFGVTVTNQNAITPRTDWTEMDELGGGGYYKVESQYRTDTFETTASASWTDLGNARWIAAEMKIEIGAAEVTLDPFGMSGFFGA